MSSVPEKGRLHREIWAVVISLAALLIAISLISYDVNDRSLNTPSGALNTRNWGGFIGAFLADLVFQGLGFASYLVPIFLCVAATDTCTRRRAFKESRECVRYPDSTWRE